MQLLVFFAVATSALAIPGGYLPPSKTSRESGGMSYGTGATVNSKPVSYGESSFSSITCRDGRVLDVYGKCVKPIVNYKVQSYVAPKRIYDYGPPPYVPRPKLNYNVVFVQTPEGPKSQDPIVVPPAQQQTVVYVLSKDKKAEPVKVIQLPDQPRNPEVYYVSYNDGESAQLPGGIDLDTALASANSIQGQFVNGVSPGSKNSRSKDLNPIDKYASAKS